MFFVTFRLLLFDSGVCLPLTKDMNWTQKESKSQTTKKVNLSLSSKKNNRDLYSLNYVHRILKINFTEFHELFMIGILS